MRVENTIRSILATNIGCKPGERLAVVTDTLPFAEPTSTVGNRATLAEQFAQVAESMCLTAAIITYPTLPNHGVEPPVEVFDAVFPDGFVADARRDKSWEALQAKSLTPSQADQLARSLEGRLARYDAVIALSGHSITHTLFRKLLTGTGRVRVATMPGVEPHMFGGTLLADWPSVAARSRSVAAALTDAVSATLTSHGGQSLTFSLAGRKGIPDTGYIDHPGEYGNLPAGEAYIAPVEGTANGRVAVGLPGADDSAVFVFDRGEMVAIVGNSPDRERLDLTFTRHPAARKLAELGVGTNEKAKRADSLLEAEKILGTCHVALGHNASFGGNVSVPFHEDWVVYSPTLELRTTQGKVLTVLEAGRLFI